MAWTQIQTILCVGIEPNIWPYRNSKLNSDLTKKSKVTPTLTWFKNPHNVINHWTLLLFGWTMNIFTTAPTISEPYLLFIHTCCLTAKVEADDIQIHSLCAKMYHSNGILQWLYAAKGFKSFYIHVRNYVTDIKVPYKCCATYVH